MTRQSIMRIAVAAGVLAGLGVPASAHHSGAMFDPETTIHDEWVCDRISK